MPRANSRARRAIESEQHRQRQTVNKSRPAHASAAERALTLRGPVAKNPLERWPRVQILGRDFDPRASGQLRKEYQSCNQERRSHCGTAHFYSEIDKELRVRCGCRMGRGSLRRYPSLPFSPLSRSVSTDRYRGVYPELIRLSFR